MEHESPLPEPVEYVQAKTLQDLFNAHDYRGLAESGQLRMLVKKEKHLSFPEAKGMPRCTMGQFIEYLDEAGQWHAQAYQYVMPNGKLGASGLPDPKRIRIGGKILALQR